MRPRRVNKWPLYIIGSSAAAAVWSGWVGLGGLTGFGPVHLLPGIWNTFVINTAITLPIGVEAYGVYSLGVWISPDTPKHVRKYAKWSAIGSLVLGALGQIAYHLLAAAHRTAAPWEIITLVSCLPVLVLGLASGLHHLRHVPQEEEPATQVTPGGRVHPVEPVAGPAQPGLAELMQQIPEPTYRPGTAEPTTDVHQFGQPLGQPMGQVTVRSPLARADRKIPVDERIAGRATGSFPAVRE